MPSNLSELQEKQASLENINNLQKRHLQNILSDQ